MGVYDSIGPADEYPIHQAGQPVARPSHSDTNFYDRCYLNAHDRTGEIFLITGFGVYPNLGTKDAFVLLRRGDEQTAVHLSDALDPGDNRLEQRVGNYSIEVVEPLQRLRVVMAETEGIELDLTWTGAFPVLQEQRHLMHQGSRTILDAQRFAQVGNWSGTIAVDGDEIAVSSEVWCGTRDRSWGIRPVGEAPTPGRPASPEFEGMWWLYVPIQFDDFAVVLIMQEEPDGYRTLNDCHRIFADGRVEQLGWPAVTIHYAPGTREPTGATIGCTLPDGSPFTLEVSSLLGVPIHVGGGYGGDSDWTHGMWRGEKFTERLTYSLSDPDVAGRVMFGVIDHVGRAVATVGSDDGDRVVEGWGLFEHGALGRHDPSGFTDWFDLAD